MFLAFRRHVRRPLREFIGTRLGHTVRFLHRVHSWTIQAHHIIDDRYLLSRFMRVLPARLSVIYRVHHGCAQGALSCCARLCWRRVHRHLEEESREVLHGHRQRLAARVRVHAVCAGPASAAVVVLRRLGL